VLNCRLSGLETLCHGTEGLAPAMLLIRWPQAARQGAPRASVRLHETG
jgi:hypothetical protein